MGNKIMFDEKKNLIKQEKLNDVAGGQDNLSFLFQKQIVHCSEFGQEIPIYGNHTGFSYFMTCPNPKCNKGITFRT